MTEADQRKALRALYCALIRQKYGLAVNPVSREDRQREDKRRQRAQVARVHKGA